MGIDRRSIEGLRLFRVSYVGKKSGRKIAIKRGLECKKGIRVLDVNFVFSGNPSISRGMDEGATGSSPSTWARK